jgi:uncharacterized protein (TIGR03437 family)
VPSFFTQAQSGSGQAVVVGVRTDGMSFVNGPDVPLYEGDVMNSPVTAGDPSPIDPVARTAHPAMVRIGDANCEVLFSGLTPGFVGLYLNAILPPGVAKGREVPMLLSTGGQASPMVSLHGRAVERGVTPVE